MYQKIVLVGNLGRDPELRFTSDGTPVANFSLATNESWTKDGERQERTTWWRVTCWRKLGETVAQYLSKGRKVLVEGRMNPDPETGGPKIWTGDDGVPRASYEITALEVKFLDSRGSGDGDTVVSSDDAAEDVIPF